MVAIAVIHFTNYPKGQSRGCMRAVMRYAAQEKKTRLPDGQRLVSGVNCRPESAYSDFLNTKLLHHKEGGVLFFHMVQSFPKGEEVDPKTAPVAALRLAQAFGDREVLVCTHNDREHIHSHFIINSVSFNSGKKLHISQPELVELRQQNDAICQEFGLPVFQKQPNRKKVKSMSGAEYHAAVRGESWKMRLVNVIDQAMQYAGNKEQFIQLMQTEGYQVKWTDSRKNITYTTPEGQPCRDNKLHEDKYLKEAMEHEFKLRVQIISRKIEATEPTAAHAGGARISADQRGSGIHDGHDIGYIQSKRSHIGQHETAAQAGEYIENTADLGANICNAEGAFAVTETGWEAEREAYFSATYQVQDATPQPGLAPADPDWRGLVGDAIQLGRSMELAANADPVIDSTTMAPRPSKHDREKRRAMGEKFDDEPSYSQTMTMSW